MVQEQSRKSHRLLTKFRTNCELGRRAVIALIKEQIKGLLNYGKARREVGCSLWVEEPIGPGQDFLSPWDPLLHRRICGHEGTRDLVNTKPAQDMKDES